MSVYIFKYHSYNRRPTASFVIPYSDNLTIGYRLPSSIVSHRLFVISYRLSLISYQLFFILYQLSVISGIRARILIVSIIIAIKPTSILVVYLLVICMSILTIYVCVCVCVSLCVYI